MMYGNNAPSVDYSLIASGEYFSREGYFGGYPDYSQRYDQHVYSAPSNAEEEQKQPQPASSAQDVQKAPAPKSSSTGEVQRSPVQASSAQTRRPWSRAPAAGVKKQEEPRPAEVKKQSVSEVASSAARVEKQEKDKQEPAKEPAEQKEDSQEDRKADERKKIHYYDVMVSHKAMKLRMEGKGEPDEGVYCRFMTLSFEGEMYLIGPAQFELMKAHEIKSVAQFKNMLALYISVMKEDEEIAMLHREGKLSFFCRNTLFDDTREFGDDVKPNDGMMVLALLSEDCVEARSKRSSARASRRLKKAGPKKSGTSLQVDEYEESDDEELELADFLESVGLSRYFEPLSKQEIDMDTLLAMGQEDFKELDMTFGARKKLQKGCDELRAKLALCEKEKQKEQVASKMREGMKKMNKLSKKQDGTAKRVSSKSGDSDTDSSSSSGDEKERESSPDKNKQPAGSTRRASHADKRDDEMKKLEESQTKSASQIMGQGAALLSAMEKDVKEIQALKTSQSLTAPATARQGAAAQPAERKLQQSLQQLQMHLQQPQQPPQAVQQPKAEQPEVVQSTKPAPEFMNKQWH